MPTNPGHDVVHQIRDLIAGAESGKALVDVKILERALSEIEASHSMRQNIARWLRARAELALSKKDDPEQPGYEALAQGWRQGSYNNLHSAANSVERGEAELPSAEWPNHLKQHLQG